VDIDQHVAVHSFIKSGAIDFAWLEDDVAIAKQADRAPPFDVLDGIEGVGIETIGEGVVDEEMGDGEEPQFVGMLGAITLESTKVIGVAKARAMLFENLPVVFRALRADFLDEMVFEIGSDAIIVEQGVIDVEEENEV